ncbi:hypothetical protein M1N80_03200 [Peptococcaceae bacterium]|nr:hypothetical protein [Peptococcaceae bacterium]
MGKEKIKGKSEFLLLEMLSDYTRWPIPASLRGLDKRKVLHTDKIAPVDMKQKVANILGV